MELSWVDGDLPGAGDARLVAPTPALASALARSASRGDAILRSPEEHFVSWLEGRTQAEREIAIIESVPATSTIDIAAPWALTLLVTVEDCAVGVQRLVSGDHWPDRRTVYTSGWLLRTHQGRGIGRAARRAVLEFAFDQCAAEAARSHVLVENLPSRRISEGLGYRQVGEKRFEEGGREIVELVYEVTAADFLAL